MSEFLEERLAIDVRMGATYADEFNVEITRTAGKKEYRRLVEPFPERHFAVNYTLDNADLWARVIALYHRAYGMYSGFRVWCKDDNSTNGHTGTPTALDHPAALVSAGVYQLQKRYGLGATALSIGYPVRTIFKPVAGSIKVGVNAIEIAGTGWTSNTTTGQVTFNANKTAVITGITRVPNAVVSCAGHTFVAGESVHFSGVAGMLQINGLRGIIVSVVAGVSITVAINSSAFSVYGSAGTANTRPQTGEVVTAGCLFDIPARFNSRIDIQHISANVREAGSIDLIELIDP